MKNKDANLTCVNVQADLHFGCSGMALNKTDLSHNVILLKHSNPSSLNQNHVFPVYFQILLFV